jgi:HEAT repeat protein
MQQIVDSGTPTANPPKTGTAAAMEEALAAFSGDAGGAAALRALQKRDPLEFARAAIQVLASGEPSPGLKVVAELVASSGLIVDLLLLQGEIPVPTAAAALKGVSVTDPLFEIRMIRKVIQDYGEVGSIPPGIALRLLKILDKTSDCSRLTNHLIQFVRHPSQHVRSKSVLLMGRGNVNLNRTKEYLLSPVPRVRANAVESIWDHPDAGIRKTLQESSRDSSQRVAVNALVGLSRLGDMEASRRLAGMAKSQDPVARAGAAWGMGHVNRPEMAAEFRAVLELLAGDPDSKVADMARRSLEAVGQVPDLPATNEDVSGTPETSPAAKLGE